MIFQFFVDHVFDQECSNARIYELLTKDIISAAVDGFNGRTRCLILSPLSFVVWLF